MKRRHGVALFLFILAAASVSLATVFAANDNHYYRFESTASNSTAVTDGATLRLDGTSQIQDSIGTLHANPFSTNGVNFGTYESTSGAVSPVPIGEIAGATGNNFFAKLNNANKEGLSLGDYDVGSGLTFEGWFYPTGTKANAYDNARLITKRSAWQPGNFWAYLNAEGGVTFGVYAFCNEDQDYDTGKPNICTYHEWSSSANKVDWTKWNYISIVWQKSTNKVDFYIKPAGSALFHETVTNTSYFGFLPNTSDTVTIGYNAGFDRGFEGFMDEIKVSNHTKVKYELLVNQTDNIVPSNGDFLMQLDPTGDANIPTFGAFNRHVAEINGMYYVSYHDANQYIRIVKSADGGRTWSDLYASGNHTGDQPAVIDVDNNGRLHAVWTDGGTCRYMRFSGAPLVKDIDKTIGNCTTKFAMVYNPVADVLYMSRRDNSADAYLIQYDTSGNQVSSTKIINHVGTFGQPVEYWDAHYQSLYVDAAGRLHMIFTPHKWADASITAGYERVKVMYMYSDNHGVNWKKADGTNITVPFDANNLTAATPASSESHAWGASVLATANHVHILYARQDGTAGEKYIRLNRSTGVKEKDYYIPDINVHSVLIADPNSNKLYIATEENNRPSLFVSTNSGDSWGLYSHLLVPPTEDLHTFTSALQKVSGGSILAINTDYGNLSGARIVNFYKFRVDANQQYRFENTASNTTAVSDGASLRLDGATQIKDSLGSSKHGTTVSANGVSYGTYESAVGAVTPVAFSEIKGAAANNYFANLDNDNDEGISLGDFDLDSGLTIEGWFRPTGNKANAYSNARLVTKRTAWQSGNFWAYLNANGGVTFGVKNSGGEYEWISSNNKVDWTKWNYVAITWTKNSNTVDFYIKPAGSALFSETITNGSYTGTFPNTSDTVSIGYNAGFDLGYEGYLDEIKLSDYKMRRAELSLP